jgi:hypothetical protein
LLRFAAFALRLALWAAKFCFQGDSRKMKKKANNNDFLSNLKAGFLSFGKTPFRRFDAQTNLAVWSLAKRPSVSPKI